MRLSTNPGSPGDPSTCPTVLPMTAGLLTRKVTLVIGVSGSVTASRGASPGEARRSF